MFLYYNGIRLQMERLAFWNQQAVYSEDGADFLYHAHRIGVQAVFNPKLMPDTANDATASYPKDLDDVKTKLMTSKKLLQLTIGNTVVFQSPLTKPDDPSKYFAVDAKLGPRPIDCRILSIHGGKTALVFFEIETWINPCNESSLVSPLVSHRWQMTHDLDQLYYATRIITGRAIFRSDYMLDPPQNLRAQLAAAGANPLTFQADDFRKAIFHPIEPNFKREKIHVDVASDGLSASYFCVDVQQPTNLGKYVRHGTNPSRLIDNPVIKFKGTLKSGKHNAPALTVGQLSRSVGTSRDGTQIQADPIQIAQGLSSLMFVGAYLTVSVEVWGRPESRRRDLIDACVRALSTFNFHRDFIARTPTFHGVDLTVDLENRQVRLDWSFQVSGIGKAINDLAGMGNKLLDKIFPGKYLAERGIWDTDLVDNFPDEIGSLNPGFAKPTITRDGATTVMQYDRITNDPASDVTNPEPDRSGAPGAVDSSYIGRMIAQALREPCAVPDAPVTTQAMRGTTPIKDRAGFASIRQSPPRVDATSTNP